MESIRPGELVKVDMGGAPLDGIVFDVPSHGKVVVAVVDRSRGPALRTVHPKTLSERAEEGPDDRALWLLIRRTPAPPGAGGRAESGARQTRAGHTRTAMHRTTGR